MKYLYVILALTLNVMLFNVQAQTISINDLKDAKSDADGTQNGSSIFLGIKAGQNDNQSNNRNIGIGFSSLKSNVNGTSNVAIGNYALQKNKTANNVAIGDLAMSANINGQNNVALGYQSGLFFEGKNLNSNLQNSIFIGSQAKAYSQNDQNEIVIGYKTLGNGSNSITLGNAQNQKTILTGKVGIGTNNPKYNLDILKNMRIFNGFGASQLFLDGSKGNSETVFLKNGKYKAAVGYNADADYVYIYKSGNVKFKNGNVIADADYKFAKPKTYTYTIAPSDFRIYYNHHIDAKITYTDAGSLIIKGADNKAAVLIAPVHLPEGAKITNIRIYSEIFNNSVMEIKLKEKNALKRDSKLLSEITESGNLDVHEKNQKINNITVSNKLHHYYIVAKFVTPNLGSYVMLNGIFIDYQMDHLGF